MTLANRHSLVLKVPNTANYSSAIARAVEWLGDRYLLAKPINAAADRAHGGTDIVAASTHNPQQPAASSV